MRDTDRSCYLKRIHDDVWTRPFALTAGVNLPLWPLEQVRDALLVQRAAGVKKRMMLFVLEDPEPVLWGGERIFRDGCCVGSTTSGSYGHAVGGAVALGYVKNGGEVIAESELLTGGFEIDIAGKRFPARATLKPPYDPERKKLK